MKKVGGRYAASPFAAAPHSRSENKELLSEFSSLSHNNINQRVINFARAARSMWSCTHSKYIYRRDYERKGHPATGEMDRQRNSLHLICIYGYPNEASQAARQFILINHKYSMKCVA
jgi:hypothetical protein